MARVDNSFSLRPCFRQNLAQEGAAARRGGRKKVEDVDAAAVAIQRTLRGKRGRARARASKG